MARLHHRPLRLAIEVGLALVVGVALALAIDVGRSGGIETWLAARGLGPAYEAKGQRVDLGGRSLYLDCRGTGSPTVILDNGLGAGADGWGFVLPKLAERTRTCAYDRPGTGRSDPRASHTMGQTIEDLRAALARTGERPPWIVVGHSLGGVYARVFAGTAPEEVVGVVLVDAYFPDGDWAARTGVDPGWLADVAAAVDATNAMVERQEGLRWAASMDELAASKLDSLPLEVLAVDQHLRYDDPRIPPDMEERIIAAWRAWCLELSPGATTVTIAERSGHVIQLDRPDVVIAAVDRILAAGQ
jgi:pimeloyl-ACP methyl ester carboxylesterase